jgi:hypothetical protein
MKYEIKFFKDDVEIEVDDLPDDYVTGILEIFKNELVSRGRFNRVVSRTIKEGE